MKPRLALSYLWRYGLAAILVLQFSPAFAQPFAIDWFTVAGGGGNGSDGTHLLSGTIGQADAGGPLTNAQFSLVGGFWAVSLAQGDTPPIFVTSTNTVTVSELSTLVYTNVILEVDPSKTNFSWTLLTPISGLALNPTNGVLTWTPAEGQAPSTNTVLCEVTDSGSPPLSSTGTVIIIVQDVNQAPIPVSLPNMSVLAGNTLSLQLQANDPDIPPEQPIWGVASLPPGASLTTNGLYSYTPGPSDSGFKTNIVYVYDFNANAINPNSPTNFLTFAVQVTGRRLVTNTNDSGPGSLRQAITDTAADPLGGHIEFNIPGTGPQKIAPITPLPALGNNTYIDGYTQPGAHPNTRTNGTDAVLLIELSGENITAGGQQGLQAGNASGVIIRGLCINNFANNGYGIISSACFVLDCTHSDIAVEGCFIGTDTTGTLARPNTQGVLFGCACACRIGGPDLAQRNLISGNLADGLDVGGFGANNNVVQNNLIGTDRTGTNALGNGNYGLSMGGLSGSGGAFIADNVICANGLYGVNEGETADVFVRNKIGVGADGVTPLGNGSHGVLLNGTHHLLGGTNRADANVLAYNNGSGAYIYGQNITVWGNSIFRNTGRGIKLDPGANNNQSTPKLSSVSQAPVGTIVTGTLTSLSNTTYRVELFYNPDFAPTNQPQAWLLIGVTNVTTDSSSNATFSVTCSQSFAGGFFTATATDLAGNTSSVSDGLSVLPPRLDIALVSGQARVFWLTNLGGFILQSNGSIVQPLGWGDVPGTPGVFGSNFFRDFTPTNAPGFFRLRSP